MTKIKVFLGAYINSTNAQNLYCLDLAKFLNKEKFSIYTLEVYSGNLDSQQEKIPGVKIFTCFKPFRISKYLGFLWGILHCDVVYLPKHELWKFNRFLLKLLNKTSFSTADGILDTENIKSAIEVLGSKKQVMECYSFTDKKFPLTKFIGEYNWENHQLPSENTVLFLGCENTLFSNDFPRNGNLKKIAFIGRLKKRKGIYDFLEIARKFPELEFLLFGDGEEEEAIKIFCKENNIFNCRLMGVVNHLELSKQLVNIDLHIFPSRSEGFGKVTIETAAAGVPSILYSDYGVGEWVSHGKNGWVVDTLAEMIDVVKTLKQHPEQLKLVANNAKELAKSFDWSVRVMAWEKVILSLSKNNKR